MCAAVGYGPDDLGLRPIVLVLGLALVVTATLRLDRSVQR